MNGVGWRDASALSAAQVTALLRIRATDPGGPSSCGPDDVAARISDLDAAAGHRYARLNLSNTSGRACSVNGYPGIGVRGEWGSRFELAAEHREPRGGVVDVARLVLPPGGTAVSNVEWTGELAGAESERASVLVIQLAQDQHALAIPAAGEVASDSGGLSGQAMPLDIGARTTVRIGPMHRPSV